MSGLRDHKSVNVIGASTANGLSYYIIEF